MQHGSILAIGISITVLLLALTYVNVYMVYVLRRKQLEHYLDKQRWATIVQEERDRLMEEVAKDVHDNIGQLTHVLRMAYHRMFKDIDEELRQQLRKDAADLIDSIAHHARNIWYTLDKEHIASRGLAEMLIRDAELIEMAGLIDCRADIMDANLDSLDNDQKLIIYRIAQEALHNALKHADARIIRIKASYKSNLFILSVEDDGRGFVVSGPGEREGIGISNMEKRTYCLGGRLSIFSEPQKGTRILLEIPAEALQNNGR